MGLDEEVEVGSTECVGERFGVACVSAEADVKLNTFVVNGGEESSFMDILRVDELDAGVSLFCLFFIVERDW